MASRIVDRLQTVKIGKQNAAGAKVELAEASRETASIQQAGQLIVRL